MSKRVFDCCSSDSSPFDTEVPVAQGAQDTVDSDDNDLSNPVESNSEEDKSSTRTSSPKP